MKDASGLAVLERLRQISGATTDKELAEILNLSRQAIAQAKARDRVPSSWIPKAAMLFNVTSDWLLFGKTPMLQGETQKNQNSFTPREEGRSSSLEEERRELSAENRQLHRDKAALLQEIAGLRERVARLEAQVAMCDILKGGSTHTVVPASAPAAPSMPTTNDRA